MISGRLRATCFVGLLAAGGPGWAAADEPSPASPSPTPTASPAAAAASPSPSPAAPGTFALVVDQSGAQPLLGLPVQTAKGEDLGHVVDVIIDRKGALMAAIVDFGGFLGVGTRKIAVDWHILHLPEKGPLNKLVADLPLDQLRNAPAFKPGEPIVIMGAPPAAAPAPVASSTPAPTASPTPEASAAKP